MPVALRKTVAASPKALVRPLTIFLLRENVTKPEDALDPSKKLTRYPVPIVDGTIYVADQPGKEPKWIGFVREGLAEKLPPLKNTTVSAALFFKTKKRWFAVTFGFGRHFLKPDSFVLDFGVKVTLNTVDPTKLRSLDTRTVEEAMVHTRQQASRSSPIDTFAVDTVRDVLGAVTGEPSDPKYGRKLAGRDALAVTVKLRLPGLPEYASKLVEAYESDAYKTSFEWFDHIRAVRDTAEVAKLDEKLVEVLNDRNFSKMYLAPPEMLPTETFPEFRYPGELSSEEPHSDLTLEECVSSVAAMRQVGQRDLELTLDDLKWLKIRVSLPESETDYGKWSIYKCISFEFDGTDALYVLSAGDWFRIEKNYATRIKRKLGKHVKPTTLPDAALDEEEDAYNARVAPLVGAALLDKQLVKAEDAKHGIEACDLLTKDGMFVHVKRKTRSSTLSHLFSQGSVAGEVFLRDEVFRNSLHALVTKLAPQLAHLFSNPAERPRAEAFGVVYAVISRPSKGGGVAKELPFFSQVNFVRSAERLTALGYPVSLMHIPER